MKPLFIIFGVILNSKWSCQRFVVTSDDLENHISPDDLHEFYRYYDTDSNDSSTPRSNNILDSADAEESSTFRTVPALVDCFGLGSISRTILSFFNMKPDEPDKVNTHFYFSSRLQPKRVQVYPGKQFGLEWVDFKPHRKTVMIVHGFMSHSNASWVTDMTRAFLQWGDVNVIAVDWSGGGNTWKYWRAVANTRRVGSDITKFLKQLMNATGANIKNFHFIGHSLGAHIASFASNHCGRVARITGLDPAHPCFDTPLEEERLDYTDADYVDVIHTNGRLLQKIGFGMPNPIDLQQAVCSHGRAYVLFTESLINNNCSFRAYRWDLSYEGINVSLNSTCDRLGSCAEMGIKALGEKRSQTAHGPYILLTTDKEPYCVTPKERRYPLLELLRDLRHGFLRPKTTTTESYADPFAEPRAETTTQKPRWWNRWFG